MSASSTVKPHIAIAPAMATAANAAAHIPPFRLTEVGYQALAALSNARQSPSKIRVV